MTRRVVSETKLGMMLVLDYSIGNCCLFTTGADENIRASEEGIWKIAINQSGVTEIDSSDVNLSFVEVESKWI